MKNIKTSILIAFLLMASFSFAQSVKFKDNKVTIDNNQIYIFVKSGSVMTLSSNLGTEFATVHTTSYDEKNPAHTAPNGQNFPEMRRVWLYNVKFSQSGREMTTDMNPRDLVKAFHESKMVVEEGIIDEEQLKLFIEKYNNEKLKK